MKNRKLKPKISPQTYRKFIHQVELNDLYLKKAIVEVFRDQIPHNQEFAALNTIRDDVTLIDEKTRGFRVLHTFRFKITDKEAPKTVIARMRFELVAGYSTKQPITQDIFEVFKFFNVPLNTWPYAREFIHSTVMRLGLPPVLLPVRNM